MFVCACVRFRKRHCQLLAIVCILALLTTKSLTLTTARAHTQANTHTNVHPHKYTHTFTYLNYIHALMHAPYIAHPGAIACSEDDGVCANSVLAPSASTAPSRQSLPVRCECSSLPRHTTRVLFFTAGEERLATTASALTLTKRTPHIRCVLIRRSISSPAIRRQLGLKCSIAKGGLLRVTSHNQI